MSWFEAQKKYGGGVSAEGFFSHSEKAARRPRGRIPAPRATLFSLNLKKLMAVFFPPHWNDSPVCTVPPLITQESFGLYQNPPFFFFNNAQVDLTSCPSRHQRKHKILNLTIWCLNCMNFWMETEDKHSFYLLRCIILISGRRSVTLNLQSRPRVGKYFQLKSVHLSMNHTHGRVHYDNSLQLPKISAYLSFT